MSKTKSVVMTVIITIVIVLLCLMCVVPEFTIPFRVGGIWTQYNSVINVIDYGSDLGGGYSAVYYPDGVVSAETYNGQVESYEATLDAAIRKQLKLTDEDEYTLDELIEAYEESGAVNATVEQTIYDMEEYVGSYVGYTSANFSAIADDGVDEAAIYLEVNEICTETSDGVYEVNDDFIEDFETAVTVMSKRFDKKKFSYLNVSVLDDYSIYVSVPYTVDDPDSLFAQMGYTGDFNVRAGEDVQTRPLLRAFGSREISDYFRGASSTSSGSTGVVKLKLTSLGKETLYDITDALRSNETDATLYFYVGDTEVIGLDLSSEDDGIERRTWYVSGDFTVDEAENVGIVINSCIKQGSIDFGLTVSDTIEYTVETGSAATTAIYIIFAVLMLAMFIFFIVRYRGLGVAHMFGYLSYLICMMMFIAFLPGMLLTSSGVLAVALTSIMMVLFNIYIFENIRKEFATGKTIEAAVKAGYKRSLAPVLDTHILLFIISLVLYFVSVSDIVLFSYIFILGVVMSGVSTLLLTRYYAYVMRGVLDRGKQYRFYGFKREVVDDDDD